MVHRYTDQYGDSNCRLHFFMIEGGKLQFFLKLETNIRVTIGT